MHEMSLMAGVFDLIKENLNGYQIAKVTKVTLKVGDLTNVVPEAMSLAFEAYSKDTLVEGADLEIIRVPLTIGCLDCSKDSIIEEPVFRCPHCGSTKVELRTGRELYLDSMEVE